MKLPQLRQVRLLPVVIAATGALLLLKGLGLMTGGGYVLTGPVAAVAAGGAPAASQAAPANGATLTMPAEPTIMDMSPVLEDTVPTLPLHAEGTDAHGAPAGDAHDTEVAESHGEDVSDDVAGEASPATPPDPACATGGMFDFILGSPDCPEAGMAVEPPPPVIRDGSGNVMPSSLPGAMPESEAALLARLAERRGELDTREAELDMRLALVEAAEKRIAERTAALEALEARINAMVDEKRTLEEAQFVAVVSMYETMKPKDAAAIFDQLAMSVLQRVARAMNPRKMAPVLARMNPSRAQELTAALAVNQVEPTIEVVGENLAVLPQIIGE